MTPERLAEIRQFAEAYRGTGLVRRRPNSAIAHRGELLAELDRLREQRDGLLDEYAIRVRDPEDHATWRTEWGFSTAEEALDSLGGSCRQPRTVLHRLVSEWQTADTNPKD